MPDCWSCWRCWPKMCKCPPSEDEIDRLREDRFISERKFLTEQSRRRSAESVISQIQEMAGSGEITISEVVDLVSYYCQKYGK